MNYSKQFIRKITYIAIIAILVIPLSFVGQPSTRDRDNSIRDQGGVLAQLRNEENLSQASLSDIDPASETMKLASLGLRGLAVNLLWMQAIDAKQKKKWDDLTATLNTLVKLQPSFVSVWKFQAHNLSYNVSVEYDDYQYRYEWVKRGINFLTQGIDANKRDHRIIDELGFFSGNKFGTADERVQYRRLFRQDEVFHDKMDEFVNVELIDTPYGPDNWLLAYQWYRRSENMVENGVDGQKVRPRKKEMIFYQQKPAQLRNLMLSLQDEFRVDQEYAQLTWSRAHEEWMDYGTRPLRSPSGFEYNMERLGIDLEQIQQLRDRLDELVPGKREELREEMIQQAVARNALTPRQLQLLELPLDQLTDEERSLVREAEAVLFQVNQRLESQIADAAPIDKRGEAVQIAKRIEEIQTKMRRADTDRSTVNYKHWRERTAAEATLPAIRARQAEYDATELTRRSIYNEYRETDPITGKTETHAGAIQQYDRAFSNWAEIFEQYPSLTEGPLIADVVRSLKRYSDIRTMAGLLPWHANHPLQDIVDRRARAGRGDNLYTSEEIREMQEKNEMFEGSTYGLPLRPNIEFSLNPSGTGPSESNGSTDSQSPSSDSPPSPDKDELP